MGYDSAISTVFQMQLCFPNLGINNTQNSSASQVYKVVMGFSKQAAARRETERSVL